MTDLADIRLRCLEILAEMPMHPCAFRSPGGPPPTARELREALWRQNIENRERIDSLCRQLTLDWKTLHETHETWFLVEQRIRGAVFVCEGMCGTLAPGDLLSMSADTPDEALEWALVRLWRFAGPLWLSHAARLIAAGMDLGSRESPPR